MGIVVFFFFSFIVCFAVFHLFIELWNYKGLRNYVFEFFFVVITDLGERT
jgi:hypothetical protein